MRTHVFHVALCAQDNIHGSVGNELAVQSETLRTTLAGRHPMFADTLLLKTMMDILHVDVRSPGAEVSPGNRSPL